MSQERRRYFRINDTIKLSYKSLPSNSEKKAAPAENEQGYLKKEDKQILELIRKLSKKQPEVAAVMALFNQKLDRLSNLITIDGKRLDSISMQLKKVNISACGMAFYHGSPIELNSTLELEIALLPDEQILKTQGRIVACNKDETHEDEINPYYVRIDFYAMDMMTQEKLIQHIVKNQIIG